MINPIDTTRLESLGISNQPRPRETSLGQDEFLQLMVAQIRQQDPFEPMQNGEFIAQLAQFGTVSGIKELQGSFSGLRQSLVSGQGLQASNLIGRSVRIPAATFELQDSEGMQGAVSLPVGSESTIVNINDASGKLVQQIQLGVVNAGQTPFSWNGMLANGERAPAGNYRMVAESVVGGKVFAAETFLELEVSSVSLGFNNQGQNQLSLNLENGDQVDFAAVRQIL